MRADENILKIFYPRFQKYRFQFPEIVKLEAVDEEYTNSQTTSSLPSTPAKLYQPDGKISKGPGGKRKLVI